MTTVTEEQLLVAVAAMRVSLMAFDEDAANDPKALAEKIKDDHPMWKKGVNEASVSKALQAIKDAEVPPYTPPEALYPLETLWSGVPLHELADPEGLKVEGIHHAQGGLGSKGSYILACAVEGSSRPGLIVMKEAHPGFPAEVFASNVLRRMGLDAPHFRPLSLSDWKKFTWKLRSVPVTIKGTCGAIHSSRAQESGGVFMEFLSGTQLPESDPSAFEAESVQRDLGRCMAVDIVLNCLDRTPIAWDNKGNPTNILVSTSRLGIIDNAYNRITNIELAKKHVDKVRNCAIEARSGAIGPHAEKIRQFMSSSTNSKLKLSDEQLKSVFKFFVEACDELASNHKEIFEESAKETRSLFENAGASSKQLLDDCLNLDFCIECALALKE